MQCFLPVVGDTTALCHAFVDVPGRWLPDARQVGADDWLMTVHAGQFARTVTARIGAPWRADETHWRSLSWDPVGEDTGASAFDRLLPALDGELGLNLAGGRATLLLDARYDPPGGAVGTVLDNVALHRVARGTLDRLLADIAARLSAEALLTVPDHATHEPPDTAGSERERHEGGDPA